jgi:hypothetical protein
MFVNNFAKAYDNNYLPDGIKEFEKIIPDDFVISRTRDNKVLSLYKDDVWDFSSYTSFNNKLRFATHYDGCPSELDLILTQESKLIMFMLIYDPQSEFRNNKMGTFHSLLSGLRKIVDLCRLLRISISESEGSQKFQDTFLNSVFNSSLYKNKAARPVRQLLNALKLLSVTNEGAKRIIPSLIVSEKNRSSVMALLIKEHIVADRKSYPTPLIPSRIFANLLDGLDNSIKKVEPHVDSIVRFFEDINDIHNYQLFSGDVHEYSRHVQRLKQHPFNKGEDAIRFKNIPVSERSSYLEAIKQYGLYDLITEFNKDPNDYQIFKALTKTWILMILILVECYTGMRAHEISVMDLDSYQEHDVDGFGIVSVIESYTSKVNQDNYSERTPWATSPHVQKYLQIAKKLVEARWYQNRSTKFPTDLRSIPILYSSYISEARNHEHYEYPSAYFRFSKAEVERMLTDNKYDIRIRDSDIEELMAYDAFQNWDKRSEFNIGEIWPLASHQIRKSVAVYASRSRIVSLPSLANQYKHLSENMTSMYAHNSAFARNFVDQADDRDSYSVFDLFLEAKKFNETIELHDEVLSSNHRLSGGKGVHIQLAKDKEKVPVWLKDFDETLKKVDSGEISYVSTSVGGCMRIGMCDSYGVADILPCVFECEYSVIGADGGKKLRTYKDELELGLDYMDEGSPAYLEIVKEIKRLEIKLNEVS